MEFFYIDSITIYHYDTFKLWLHLYLRCFCCWLVLVVFLIVFSFVVLRVLLWNIVFSITTISSLWIKFKVVRIYVIIWQLQLDYTCVIIDFILHTFYVVKLIQYFVKFSSDYGWFILLATKHDITDAVLIISNLLITVVHKHCNSRWLCLRNYYFWCIWRWT